MTPSPVPPTAEADLRNRMVEYIMRRDQLTEEKARVVFSRLNVADLTMLELAVNDRRPAHSFDYDPFADR
jgi:hypothetical protein